MGGEHSVGVFALSYQNLEQAFAQVPILVAMQLLLMLLVAIVVLGAMGACKLGQNHFFAVVARNSKLLFVELGLFAESSSEHRFFFFLSILTAAE